MTYPELNALFELAAKYAVYIDENWQILKIPMLAKTEFCSYWYLNKSYKAIPNSEYVRIYTSENNYEDISDPDLAKAIILKQFRSAMHELREKLKTVSNSRTSLNFNNLTSKITSIDELPNSEIWKDVIYSHADLSSEYKDLLWDFLTNSSNFWDIKGIKREDFATPALCKAINKRVDRFSICDELACYCPDKAYHLITQYLENLMARKQTKLPLLTDMNNSSLSKLYKSSLAKPFTILTGASGTGKTKLAKKLAAYLSAGDNSCLVAVGADWTDNRSVVGFVNHLRTLKEEEVYFPVYQSTPVLDLILRAVSKPEIPHFLILDEMNLSHVERYFSDFLSAMEQKDGSLLLQSESMDLPRFEGDEEKVPPSVPYPDNLFVIGTVNVDETTYMFSPKVLDRANVIEFSVNKDELCEFVRDPQPYPVTESKGEETAKAFLNLSLRARKGELEKLDAEKVIEPLSDYVKELFEIMQAGRFEFAFRSTYELIRYLQVSRELSDDKEAWDDGGWLEDLDVQILQKLLPRLHGSAGRIGTLLVKLAQYCFDPSQTHETSGFDAVTSLNSEEARFKKSFAKLKSMIETLREEHFVSFIC